MRLVGTCILLLILSAAGGCYRRVVTESFADLRSLPWAERPTESSHRPGTSNPLLRPEGWAILLAEFEGSDAYRQARGYMRSTSRRAHVPDMWLDAATDRARVLRGRYKDPFSEQAQMDLRQTRLIKVGDDRPWSDTELVSLDGSDIQLAGPLDARRFAGRGVYSLQVAAFDEAFGDGFRDAAEDYARELREDDAQAYVYQGPRYAMVTVGLFNEDDLITVRTPMPGGAVMFHRTYSPRVRKLQQRFPHNIVNGHEVIEKRDGRSLGKQASFLVLIK